jgi:hypothetical protein
MNSLLRVALATLVLSPLCAFAQSTEAQCPTLPAEAGLKWELLQGPDFRFCRALRGDDSEVFAVTISGDNPFRPDRGDRAEQGSIAGHQGYWYRSQLAGDPNLIVRETLVELDSGQVAHFSVRAQDEQQKEEAMRLIGEMRFTADQRLTSN